jgi:hypothetical protein
MSGSVQKSLEDLIKYIPQPGISNGRKNETMKPLLTILSLLIAFNQLFAQSVTGTWYSRDGTRTYSIYEKDEYLEGVLTKSERPGDEPGKIILPRLTRKGNKYKGIMHSPEENISTSVIIKHTGKRPETLQLNLKRMLFFTVRVRWYREPVQKTDS